MKPLTQTLTLAVLLVLFFGILAAAWLYVSGLSSEPHYPTESGISNTVKSNITDTPGETSQITGEEGVDNKMPDTSTDQGRIELLSQLEQNTFSEPTTTMSIASTSDVYAETEDAASVMTTDAGVGEENVRLQLLESLEAPAETATTSDSRDTRLQILDAL